LLAIAISQDALNDLLSLLPRFADDVSLFPLFDNLSRIAVALPLYARLLRPVAIVVGDRGAAKDSRGPQRQWNGQRQNPRRPQPAWLARRLVKHVSNPLQ